MAWQFRLRGLLTGGCFDEVEYLLFLLSRRDPRRAVWKDGAGGTAKRYGFRLEQKATHGRLVWAAKAPLTKGAWGKLLKVWGTLR